MNGKRGPGDTPPVLRRVRAPRAAAGTSAEVTASAAIAAGLPYQGSLATDSPLRLLYLAAAATASGRLDLEGDRGRFELHLKRGVVVHAASDSAGGGLGELLVARGLVTVLGLAEAEPLRGAFGGDIVSALASLRLLDPTHAYAVLQECGTALVARALEETQGTCRWDPAAPAPPSAFPLGSRWGALCEAARRLDAAAARRCLGDRAGRIAVRSGGRVELAQLKLTAREARAASALLAGRSSPLQLGEAAPEEAATFLTVALLLAETELLAFADDAPGRDPAPLPGPPTRPPAGGQGTAPSVRADRLEPVEPVARTTPVSAAPAPPRRPSAPVPAPAALTPAAPVQESIDESTLEELHARIARGDHFQALGVARDATTAEIKRAYFQLAKRYHPDAGLAGEPDRVKKLRVDIFARLGEAWRVLGDDAGRADYLRCLESGGPSEVDISGILEAEEIFRRAVIQVKGRQYQAALSGLEEAMRLNPDEPEFSVWTAWARFLVASDRAGQHGSSATAIEAALEKVPRCIPGYLFLAQMAKIMGDPGAAERHLKRGLALHPDAVELVRELKYLRK